MYGYTSLEAEHTSLSFVYHAFLSNFCNINFSIFQTLDSSDSRLFNPSEEVILPWSCCDPGSVWTDDQYQDEHEEESVAVAAEQPVVMANTIRGRLMAKR
jgi:hypothetical protein